jgi:hypothetical protein
MPGMVDLVTVAVTVIVAAIVVTFFYRIVKWMVLTRRMLAFQVLTRDLARRAEASLAGVSEQVDRVRRGMRPGDEITGDLARAMAATAGLAAEARMVRAPKAGASILDGIVEELERAGRALEMVDHGCQLVESGVRRELDPEAQTAVKRGYLNLVHARESIAEQANAAGRLPFAGPRFLAQRVAGDVGEVPRPRS